MCEYCLADGYEVPAVIVDHIIELADGGDRLSDDNTQSLCHACHNKKTARERKKRGAVVYSY